MNKRNLALLISKHPLLRKLTEDKTIPKSIVARLIVEELMETQELEEAPAKPKDNIATKVRNYVNRQLKANKTLQEIQAELSDESVIMQGWIKSAKSKAGENEEIQEQFLGFLKKSVNTHFQRAEKIFELNKTIVSDPAVKPSAEEQKKEIEALVAQEDEELVKAEIELYKKVQQASTELARQELDIEPIAKKFGEYEYFKPLNDDQKQVMFKFIALLKRNKLFENLIDKSSLVKTFKDLGVKKLPEMEVILQYMTEDEQQTVQKILSNQATSVDKFLAMLKKAELAPVDKEPGKEEEPSSTTDPEKFDVDPELLNSLITASETFIDEFYEKAFLKDQGVLLTSVLTVLAKIVEKEELEKAARRTSKPTEQPEETEETGTLAEQEEQPRQDPVKLRNIQVDLKSFIRLVKRSKDVLKAFDEFRAKGKVVGSSYKEKFMNILKQLQKNIKALVRDISSLNLISEKKDVSETENKWSAIEKGYNEASRSLSSIVAAGAEDIESFDMEKNVNDAYTSLMSISGFFPSVNPFGAKTTKFDEYNELYTAAVKNVKSTIRDALELAKGQGGSNTANNTIESLKEFSGQIQSIFGIPSEFEDVQVKPNEPAAEGKPETQPSSEPETQPAQEPETEPSDGETPPEVEVEEEFLFSNIQDIKTLLIKQKIKIEHLKKLLSEVDGIDGNEELVKKYYEAFLLWYLLLNEREATLQEVFWQKIPIKTREKTTEEKYEKAMEKLKNSNGEYFNTIKDFHQSLPPTIVQKFYKTFETIFEDEEINIAIDNTFINTFSKRLNLTKKTEPGEEETDDSLQEQLANKLKPLIKEMLNKGNKK